MKRSNKLNELKALATKTVAQETKKANDIISKKQEKKKQSLTPNAKTNDVLFQAASNEGEPRALPASDRTDKKPVEGANTETQKKKPKTNISGNRRFQAVLREKDFSALQQTKVFLLESGVGTVSNNSIIQAALRALIKDKKFVETYLSVVNEDQRRRYELSNSILVVGG